MGKLEFSMTTTRAFAFALPFALALAACSGAAPDTRTDAVVAGRVRAGAQGHASA